MDTDTSKVYSSDGQMFNDEDTLAFNIGETYYSGDKVIIKPSELVVFNVQYIIDLMEDELYERCGEAADGGLDYSQKDKDNLHKLITDFVDDNFKVHSYAVENIEKHVM